MGLTEFDVEQRNIESDNRQFQNDFEMSKKIYAEMLRNEVGEDMRNVMSGKTVVKVPFFKKWKFKMKMFFKRIFKTL